ncbi:hypothetical protein CFAM422_004147 [Trichoderma lentiforme]|uniref:Uncharacterized protein n=1 Tax=Trichoderma lentiforme TaxID=1567552 RepID=A0A9P4XJU2_9HYPO|nr:hypothetical protein CFAM422_004147 [Trichoderma lentiforme]
MDKVYGNEALGQRAEYESYRVEVGSAERFGFTSSTYREAKEERSLQNEETATLREQQKEQIKHEAAE